MKNIDKTASTIGNAHVSNNATSIENSGGGPFELNCFERNCNLMTSVLAAGHHLLVQILV